MLDDLTELMGADDDILSPFYDDFMDPILLLFGDNNAELDFMRHGRRRLIRRQSSSGRLASLLRRRETQSIQSNTSSYPYNVYSSTFDPPVPSAALRAPRAPDSATGLPRTIYTDYILDGDASMQCTFILRAAFSVPVNIDNEDY